MKKERLQQVLAGARTKKIAVVGDVMLDRFIYGSVSRISPEAPVPVVAVTRETSYPGGAANVARNLRPFCGDVYISGMTGVDSHAEELERLILEEGVRTDLLLRDKGVLTTVKTRVIARHQQVVRVDREHRFQATPELFARTIESLKSVGPELDALILEDYGKGFLTQEFVDEVVSIFRGTKTILTVDPNPGNPLQWQGVTAIKPNRNEAFAAAGLPPSEPGEDPCSDTELLRVGGMLLEKWGSRCLLVTLGEHGMMLFEEGAEPFHIPTKAREVFDVSGAGDTAIAVFTACLTAGATFREAADISNLASGVVVGKLGTATLCPEELLATGEMLKC